jgi:protein TonB
VPVVDPAWRSAVVGWLAAHKAYPDEARRRGEEGTVAIRFSVDRAGHVLDVTVLSSSGSARLDEAALAVLRGAVLPAFPAAMDQARITITTTLRYALR